MNRQQPTPSFSGSKLPRLYPTSNWGANISASDSRSGKGPLGSSGASVNSGNTGDVLGTTHASGTDSHFNNNASPGRGGGAGAGLAGANNKSSGLATSKMQLLEQYINRFPLVTPQLAAPIAAVLDGAADSAFQGGRQRGASVKFASENNNNNSAGSRDKTSSDDAPHPNDDKQEGESKEDDKKAKKTKEQQQEEEEDEVEQDATKEAEREISTRRQAREAAKQSYELLRRQKVDAYLQMSERNLKKVRRENETLSSLARLTQANALVNDERYERALESLRAEAELADELRQVGFGPLMAECAERIDAIQRDMQRLVVETNKRTIEELAQTRDNFEKELERFQKELEEERNSGLSTKLDWIQKNRELHRAVTEELFASDELARQHVSLETLHRRRRLDASLTTDEVKLLRETVEAARAQNARLKEKLGSLECELSLAQAKENRARAERAEAIGLQHPRPHSSSSSQHSSTHAAAAAAAPSNTETNPQQPHQVFGQLPPRPTSASLSRPSSATAHPNQQQHHHGKQSPHDRPPTAQSTATATSSSGSTDEVVAAEAQSLFDRISRTITVETRNLQTARYAHTEALKQRTELEVYLKHAILSYQSQLDSLHYSVRKGLKADSGGTGVYGRNTALAHGGTMSSTTTATMTATSKKRALLLQDIANSDGCHRVKKVEPTVFTVEDRQAVVDSLLSLPRVLTLMFDPVSAANRMRRMQQEKREQRTMGRKQERKARAVAAAVAAAGTADPHALYHHHAEEDEEDENPHHGLSDHDDGGDDDGDNDSHSAAAGVSPNAAATTAGLSTADARLYDDLAKLGVDVVGKRTGFLFHKQREEDDDDDDTASAGARLSALSSAAPAASATADPHSSASEAWQQQQKQQREREGNLAPSFVGAPSPALNEEELWERWNKWNRQAESMTLATQKQHSSPPTQ